MTEIALIVVGVFALWSMVKHVYNYGYGAGFSDGCDAASDDDEDYL